MVSIARDDRLLLVASKPARGSGEPSETIELLHWIADQGVLVWKEKAALRGQLMQYTKEEAVPVETPSAATPGGVAAPAPAGGLFDDSPAAAPGASTAPAKPGAKPTTPSGPQVDFLTGLLLIDMRGGEKQPGRDRAAKEPGEALFVGDDGSLVVHYEVADAAEWQRTTTVRPPEKKVPKPKAAPPAAPPPIRKPTRVVPAAPPPSNPTPAPSQPGNRGGRGRIR